MLDNDTDINDIIWVGGVGEKQGALVDGGEGGVGKIMIRIYESYHMVKRG